MQVELTLKQRVMLRTILPQKGTRVEMILSEALDNKLEITAEEISKFEIKDVTHDGQPGITWNNEGEKSVFSIEFLDVEVEALKKSLKAIGETDSYSKDFLKLERLLGIEQ